MTDMIISATLTAGLFIGITLLHRWLHPTRTYTKKSAYWKNVTANRRKPLKITYWNA